ncbi:MAG: flagellar basal body-associated FliL family protein [Ignavibacteriales bacterium]
MEGKLNFMLIVIIAILSMAVAFIVIYMVITGGPSKNVADASKESSKQIEKKVEIDYKKATTYDVPEMIVNLKSGGNNPKSIIKVEVGIVLSDKKFEEDIKTRELEIKDIIRSTFNGKTGDDVADTKIDQVAKELLVKFKSMYKEPKDSAKIVKVLFPNAFVQ